MVLDSNFLGFRIEEFSPTDGREVSVSSTLGGEPVWITWSIFFPVLRAKLFCIRKFLLG